MTATITDVAETPKHPGRFVVLLDGRPFATVPFEAIERLRLRPGRAADEVLCAAIESSAEELKTYDRALNALAFRARSASELRRLLVRKGEPQAQVDAVIARLLRAGLLDDADFARQVARAKVLGAGYSRRRLRQELARKGVDRGTADEAIEDVLSDEHVDEQAIIEREARKKLATLRSVDPFARRRRLYAYLARRGYDSDDIQRTLRTLLADNGNDGTV